MAKGAQRPCMAAAANASKTPPEISATVLPACLQNEVTAELRTPPAVMVSMKKALTLTYTMLAAGYYSVSIGARVGSEGMRVSSAGGAVISGKLVGCVQEPAAPLGYFEN